MSITELAGDRSAGLEASPSVEPARPLAIRSLYGPVTDFLLFGGASFIILPLLALVPAHRAPLVLQISVMVSFVINHPHFAHSYQIFYRDFGAKLAGNGYSRELSIRYFLAGIAVPVVIIAAFVVLAAAGNPLAMGTCAAVMGFFVGWHYVKQGYGLLMVDSVLKKHFFNDQEKKIFRVNAYACWIFFFLLTSWVLRQTKYFGLQYYYPPVPDPVLMVAGAAMLLTTIVAAWAGYRAHRRTGPAAGFPVAGYTAYFASLYVWLCVLFSPSVLYAIPAFHSLQYLAVVWKFETNRNKTAGRDDSDSRILSSRTTRFGIFVAAGIVLGAAGFWWIPRFLDSSIAYDRAVFGSQLFMFMFWIFINIHHYFLDNVMWRKDNPDVRRHLFSS
jgi:hypothetical protein